MLRVEELSTDQLSGRAGVSPDHVRRVAALGILSSPREPFHSGDVLRIRLVQALEQSGIVPEDIGRAIASGELSFGFVDTLFPSPASAALSDIDFEELCQRFGFSMEFLQSVYAGLGLPQPSPHDQVRQDDLDMAPVLVAITGLGLPQGAIAHATRFWGENLHNLAQAEVGFFQTYVLGPLLRSGLSEQQMLDIAVPQGAMTQELDQRVLLWLHRRHLEQNLVERILEHVEAAMERTGAIRRRPRDVPAIGFLDLSGFTALTELQGDEAAVGLTVQLSELVRSTTAQHGGRPVKFLGDGVMCHFPKPQEAVLAALEMVEAAPSAGLPAARVGLHAGPVICRDSDYFGRTVNIASRLAAYAGPDQVLVTEDLRAMTQPEGVRFERLGAVTLKGIASPLVLNVARFA
jgi:adenylate cyclase